MTVTINLPPEVEEAVRARNAGQGSAGGRWHRRWREFLANRPHTDVVLPDEAMERESIYGDHGR